MRKILCAVLLGVALATAGWVLLPRPPLLDGIPFSSVVRDREGNILHVSLAADDRYRIFVPLEQISPRLVEATLFHEDRFYGTHAGVNPVSLARAAWRWLRGAGGGGASTVTMQLARLRHGLETRTASGKCRQIFEAMCLERHYTKREILEAYFNLAPYGRNIEGAGAASWFHLHREPDALSWPEAVALSVIPQSPARRVPLAGRSNEPLNVAFRRLHARLLDAGVVRDPLGADFELRAAGRPSLWAPHFVRAVTAGGARDIRTTLDAGLQSLVERCVREHVDSMRAQGVRNAAALLVDVRSMDVLASVGSVDFFEASIHGQVDGTRSRRSPGSALKPFIYALAMEQGAIHPSTLLVDAPSRHGGYNPENFDREFCGPISAADALARSRNVPAVDLAARLRKPGLSGFLRHCGVKLERSEAAYGLSLALGGGEVTMEEMAGLYAVLANGGKLRPLRRRAADPAESGVAVLRPETAFLTLDMLARTPCPGGSETDPPRVMAWKTGTSHGFRDAWAAGVFDHYVLVVWVGNFDGRGNPAFIGRSCAGPLFFRIVDAMCAGGHARPGTLVPPEGANLRRVEFCAVSGELPGRWCSHRKPGWFVPGVSPIGTCDVHREILVDRVSGLRVLDDGGPCDRKVFEFWPSRVRSLFAQAGLPRRAPPPFHPDCGIELASREGGAPTIVSPGRGTDIVIRSGASVPLVARTDAGAGKIFWFAGRTFLGSAAAGEPMGWTPSPGTWTLKALDENGRSASGSFTVVANTR